MNEDLFDQKAFYQKYKDPFRYTKTGLVYWTAEHWVW